MYPYLEIFNRHIPTYGVCLLISIIVTYFLSVKSARKYGCSYYDLLIVGGFALLLALPSGSIFYTLVTYDFEEIAQHLSNRNFRAFGGLVFYGSFIGGILGGLTGIYVAKLELLKFEKIIIPFIPLGHAIGRIGCVMAGCCYGMEYEGLFSIHYSNAVSNLSPTQGYFPVQPLESALNVIICIVLFLFKDKVKRKFELLSLYILLYSIVRFFVEFLRGDKMRGFYFEISTSQWISVFLFLSGLVYLIFPFLSNIIRKSTFTQKNKT